MDGGQPTYLTKLRKKEKPCGPAGKQQIGSKAPIAGRDGPGPGCGGEGREWRTGERECVNEGTGASAERTRGRERERECVRVRESDALLLCYAFVAVLFFWVTFSLCVLCFAEISLHVLFVHSRSTEAACVLFFAWFGLIWFAVCFFGWLVSLQSLRRVSVAYCLLPGVYIALAARWVVRHRERERRTCLRSFRKEFFWGLFSTIL